MSNCQ